MTETELKQRTRQFGLRVMKLVDALPQSPAGRAIGMQLVRCGTAVGANYRSACRGRSRAEFASRLAIVEEEADESAYWLELIMEGRLMNRTRVESLLREADELTRIFSRSVKTARDKNPKSKIQNPK
jgi:four helix bundle protein